MAYIAPNTTIYFLEKILLTPKYEHTYYFASEADQFNFFYSKRLYERGSQSYQRVGKGQLRVEMTMEEAYRVNYMMFKNTSFENKWFYAFIVGDPIYINNTTVQINYIIDVMQSWYFDYILKPSFVERNHTSSDEFGENLEDEQLFTGYIHTVDENTQFSGLQLGCIITSKPLPNIAYGNIVNLGGLGGWNFAAGSYAIKLENNSNFFSKTFGGIASSLYFYSGIPLSIYDAQVLLNRSEISTFTLKNNAKNTDILLDPASQTWQTQGGRLINLQDIITAINLPYFNMDGILGLNFFTNNSRRCRYFYGDTPPVTPQNTFDGLFGADTIFSPEDVVAIYQYPAEFNLTQWMLNAAYLYANVDGLALSNPIDINSPNTISGYVPHNKKLFTYPYNYVETVDNEGNSRDYKYELCDTDRDINGVNYFKFRLFCQKTNNPSATLTPLLYFGENENWCNSFTLSNFMTCLYYNNSYTTWVLQNSSQNAARSISTAINLGLTLAGSPNFSQLHAGVEVHGDTENSTNMRSHTNIDRGTRARQKDREWMDTGSASSMFKNGTVSGNPYYREKRYQSHDYMDTYTDADNPNWSKTHSDITRTEDSGYARHQWDAIGLAEKVNGITSHLAEISDSKQMTNHTQAPSNNQVINNAINKKCITIKRKQISAIYAQKIDSYFDMYGYKINKITIPVTYARKYWTFVKTVNCNLGLVNSIPSEDMQMIKSCYNSGITFWTRFGGSDIGDYDNDNSISGTTPLEPIALIILKDVNGNSIQIAPAFNPLVNSYTATLQNASNVLQILVYGYCDCALNGQTLHETPDSDLQSMLFIGQCNEGTNTINVRGTQNYTISLEYSNTQPSMYLNAYSSINPEIMLNLFPAFNEANSYYSCTFSTFDSSERYIYFKTNADVDSVLSDTGSVTHEGEYYKCSLVQGTNNVTFNLVNGRFYVIAVAYSYNIPVSNFFADQTLTTIIPTTPSTFDLATTGYTIDKSDIPSNFTIYWYRPNTTYQSFTVNGTAVPPDVNQIYECVIANNLINTISFTINYESYTYIIDMR